MKLFKISVLAVLTFSAVVFMGNVAGAKTQNFTIHKGWNLVSGEVLLKNSALQNGYLMYYYNPIDKTYHAFKGGFDNAYQEYDRDYVSNDALRSMWIYNDKEPVVLSLSFDNSNLKKEEISFQKLKQGWNMLSVMNSMYYDTNGQPNNLSPNKIKGTCEIEKAYIYNAADASWVKWGIEAASFDDDTIGMGWVVKVKNDCQLGLSAGVVPPGMPN